MRYILIQQQQYTMSIVKEFKNFIRNGASVFSQAARGEYKGISPRIQSLCKELEYSSSNGVNTDKENLRHDRDNISRDASKAFHEYKKSHRK